LSLSKRKITLSTSGVVPAINRCGAELGVNLAISLHAVTDELRDVLVPLNKKYPIAELLDACRNYPGSSNARRITFEYVMLKGVNDTPAEARALVALLRGIPAKVNLIPFNPWPGAPYECSTREAIKQFSDIVFEATGRLVEEPERCRAGEQAGKRDALALSRREQSAGRIGEVVEAESRQRSGRGFFIAAAQPAPERNRLEHCQHRLQRILMADE